MSALRLAASGARADLPGSIGTGLVVGLASALVTVTGVLIESGLRLPGPEGGMLVALGTSFAGTALVLVVLVVAATTTLALRRRRHEFALLRVVGATRGQVRRQVSTELLLLSAVAAPLGAVPGMFLARWLDQALRDAGLVDAGYTSSLSPLPVLAAVLVVVPTALLAGRLAARETLRTAPTTAVRDSAADSRRVGPVRRVAAVVTAVGGLSAALTPAVLPGAMGGALAASSAFLLIGAAALAGPLLVEWTFGRAAAVSGGRGSASTRLAVGNLHGFSRRLTAVVVPLALVVAVGTTQTTVDRALQEAATRQLGDAIGTSMVATSDRGLDADRLARLAGAPGVTGVVPLAGAPAEVRVDDEGPEALAWEATRLLVVPPDVERAVLDPGVVSGDLADLAEPGTVAVSSDSSFETSTGVGDTLRVRSDGHETDLRVVAVYDRGLGLGPHIVGPATPAGLGVDATTELALVSADAAVRVDGVEVVPTARHVATAASADAGAQRLSTLLTLMLLLFVGLGSLNALVLLTAGRGGEFRLLHRTGATPRQLLAMTGAESVLTGLAAWVIGTVSVLPAVLGTSVGLVGWGVPVVDLPAYLALSAGVVALAVVATLVTAGRTVGTSTRPAR
ncbi:FtsX-like permease family protein [Nocardioides sp. zg-1228]|uniref:FtsX-like permease family protein n=1 Tax=Nocardioides sp. zg-1228 TaxID=2763008 RepID=UPI001643287C|nr:FtsX-like permease family protein [Nocardioides sp. zg-1228]MBC2934354.1 FtsX-like permease family protein [Nocardioides sp. zg-1228]QSF59130.1 FtsX-like permease family protein [Nocardioides sp. zg-1228]